MATVLDVGLFSFMLPFFIFVFTFIIIYALLAKTEILGKGQIVLNFVAAICISAVAVFTGSVTGVIGRVTPWVVFIVIVLLFLFGMFKFFGNMEDKEIWSTIGGQTVVYIIVLIVILIALSQVFETELSPYTDEKGNVIQKTEVKSEILKTLTHPRLLGALFILITSAFTVKLLVDKVG